MFSTMPSVYWSGPLKPGGMTSGQRPGPACFENSTWTPFDRMSTTLIAVVTGQRARSRGELRIVARPRLTMSAELAGAFGGGGAGVGSGGGGGTGGVANARVAENGPSVVGS